MRLWGRPEPSKGASRSLRTAESGAGRAGSGQSGSKRPEKPPAEAAGQASPYLYPSENPPSTAPSRLATLAVLRRWPTPQVRAAGRRMPTVSLTPPSPIPLLRVPQTAIVFPLVASRPLVLTLIVAGQGGSDSSWWSFLRSLPLTNPQEPTVQWQIPNRRARKGL